MKTLNLIILTFLLLNEKIIFSQTKSFIKKHNINKIEEWITYEKNNTLLKSIELYDENGNITEKITYDKNNKLKKREKFTYDKNNFFIEYFAYDNKNTIIKHEIYEYKNK